jgi:hypothetical protein
MSDTLSISDLLASQGLTLVPTSQGRQIDPFVREVYDALKSEVNAVYIFSHDAPESMLELFASTSDVVNGDAVLVTVSDEYDVSTLRRKIDYRNTLNVDKNGKPRAKVTLGSCKVGENIADTDGNAIGFRVTAK